MDINLPLMDGFEATRIIMETTPTPIIIVSSSWNVKDGTTIFKSLDAGAVAILPKPTGIGDAEQKKLTKELILTVKLMSEIKVVRRSKNNPAIHDKTDNITLIDFSNVKKDFKIIAIGASTGGPQVLQEILSEIPKDFALPILVVQHIAAGFVHGLVSWLSTSLKLRIKVAEQDEFLLPGVVYVAPDDFHMGISINRISLSKNPPENGLKPSVSYTFRSVANQYGSKAIAVLLTGMGRDGADELKLLKDAGAITIAQDKETSIVYGMPGEAVKIGGATYILPQYKIAEKIIKTIS
jgi:two-component system chemotaxis response regulator CheB